MRTAPRSDRSLRSEQPGRKRPHDNHDRNREQIAAAAVGTDGIEDKREGPEYRPPMRQAGEILSSGR
jgi:hypothetical protein